MYRRLGSIAPAVGIEIDDRIILGYILALFTIFTWFYLVGES